MTRFRFTLATLFSVVTAFAIGLSLGMFVGYDRGYADGYEAGPIRTPVGDKLVPAGKVDWKAARD